MKWCKPNWPPHWLVVYHLISNARSWNKCEIFSTEWKLLSHFLSARSTKYHVFKYNKARKIFVINFKMENNNIRFAQRLCEFSSATNWRWRKTLKIAFLAQFIGEKREITLDLITVLEAIFTIRRQRRKLKFLWQTEGQKVSKHLIGLRSGIR